MTREARIAMLWAALAFCGSGVQAQEQPQDCRKLPEEQRQPCEELRKAAEACRHAPDVRKCIKGRF